MQAYGIVVYKDPESDYGTEVPDLEGCYSAGSTISEALEQTREAIYTHLEGLAKDSEVAPKPSEPTRSRFLAESAIKALQDKRSKYLGS